MAIPRKFGVEQRSLFVAGLIALFVLVGGVSAALVYATIRSDERADAHERHAVATAFAAHAAHMRKVLEGMTADEEAALRAELEQRQLDVVHQRIGLRLNRGFGFEYVYVLDGTGQVLYSLEDGARNAKVQFKWIEPAVTRALHDREARDGIGLVVARDPAHAGMAGLLAVHVLPAQTPAQPGLRITIVAVDRVDDEFLSGIINAAEVRNIHITAGEVDATQNAINLPNLADGSIVRLAWPSERPGLGFLAGIMPVIALAATGLCLVFLGLMLRARRTAAALAVSEARARELAHKDGLTGLANRGHFIAELERALDAGFGDGLIALLFIDLDGFKEVNDSLGHAQGDELLCVVARRLRGCLGTRGLAARFGGDEFVLFLRYGQEAELASFIATLYGVLDIPITALGSNLSVSASVGAARAPEDSRSVEELMSLADVALYRAKSEGRGTYRLFEPRFESERLERRRTEAELVTALDKGELKLVFQPQVDVETERVVGFETLVRWDHPTRGRILPGEFVPVAENSRLISRLDSYVLRQACEQAKQLPGVTISVNMSPLNMRHAGMVDDIIVTLRQTDFDPHRLELEITESAILDASAEGQEALARLRELGVRIALDDFGTGHASLVHVRRFPITKIKIDKSFILNLGMQRDAASIVEYVVRLGRSLGITLTAEGVETREQLRFLRAFGAHQAQGYLFSPPLPLAAAAALLQRQQDAERQRAARPGTGEELTLPETPAQ